MDDSPKKRKIFGLSISNEIKWGATEAIIEWGAAEAIDGKLQEDGIETGILPKIPNCNDIEAVIKSGLAELKQKKPELFGEVDGIGVSTIGVVDRKALLLDVGRGNWAKPNSQHIIDFREIFLKAPGLFSKVEKPDQILLRNDASARCLTEYLYGDEREPKFKSLLYFMIGTGINGALAYRGDLLEMERHSEIGHCKPQLHPADMSLDAKFSACSAHKTCFDGVASMTRIKQQWPELPVLTPDHPAWELEVFYLAQLVMIGVTHMNPQKIRFGGAMFAGKHGLQMIEDIRSAFLEENAGYLPDYRSAAAVASLIERACFDEGVNVLAALTVGCLAAFPEDRKRTIGAKLIEYHVFLEFQRKKRKKP